MIRICIILCLSLQPFFTLQAALHTSPVSRNFKKVKNLHTFNTSLNDPPVITGYQDFYLVNEDESLEINLSDIEVTDTDNIYPNDFSLIMNPFDSNCKINGNTITFKKDFNGPVDIMLSVFDGQDYSNEVYINILVLPVNDLAVVTPDPYPFGIFEDTPFEMKLSYLSIVDVDGDYPQYSQLVLKNGDHFTTEYANNGGMIIIPEADYYGPLKIMIQIDDNGDLTEPLEFLFDVVPINDPPVVTGILNLKITEDTPYTIDPADITGYDIDSDPGDVTFTLIESNYFSVTGNTIIPAKDYDGPLYIGVEANDGGEWAPTYYFKVDVTPVNDAPVVLALNLSLTEDTPHDIALYEIEISDPDNTYNDFTLSVMEGEHYTVNGTSLIFEENYNGPVDITLQVNDGLLLSNVFKKQVSIDPVNDAPVITAVTDNLATNADGSFEFGLNNIAISDPDNIYPNDFKFTFLKGEGYKLDFNNLLHAKPLYDEKQIMVQVTVNDGKATSEPFVFPVLVKYIVTGIEGSETNTLSVSPNPASDHITITIPRSENYSLLAVRDMTGKLLMQKEITREDNQIDIHHLSSGFYFVELQQEKGNKQVVKLIKQ
jgi:hypothetical protein